MCILYMYRKSLCRPKERRTNAKYNINKPSTLLTAALTRTRDTRRDQYTLFFCILYSSIIIIIIMCFGVGIV